MVKALKYAIALAVLCFLYFSLSGGRFADVERVELVSRGTAVPVPTPPSPRHSATTVITSESVAPTPVPSVAAKSSDCLKCPRLPPSQPHLPPADNPGDPDYLPFDASFLSERTKRRWMPLLNRKVVATGDQLEPAYYKLPPVPPAPTGEAAMKLAREQGWPDHWRARMRPRHFILGPLKTGTTTLHSCYNRAMIGDPRKRSYPLATERWPIEYDKNGQAVIRPTQMIPEPYMVWNRTGARRLDVRKEWRVYHKAGWTKQENPGLEKYHYLRFPPVEKETKDWTMLDGTPFNLMTPGAADELKEDLKCAPFKPRFLVMNRDPLARGYSQFVMEQSLYYKSSRGKNFYKELEYQSTTRSGSLAKYPICQMMMREPETLMKDIRRVRQALQTCMYEKTPFSANLLPFGFVALGLKYWLHVFDYDVSLFRVVDTNSLKGLDAPQMMGLVEDVFDMKRMLPRCPAVDSKEDEEGCTAWNRYDSAMDACGSQKNSWSGMEGFTMGDPEKLKKYKKISDRWSKLLEDLIVEYNVTRWVPPKTVLPSSP